MGALIVVAWSFYVQDFCIHTPCLPVLNHLTNSVFLTASNVVVSLFSFLSVTLVGASGSSKSTVVALLQ